MSLATRLIDSLHRQAASLNDTCPGLPEQALVVSVALIGSLARDDFREGGSDVDLMIVHGHGEKPASEVAAVPAVRRLVHHFGEPLLRLGGGTGAQKPFLVDCHFVDSLVLATQPRWADPSTFDPAHADREAYLWLYAFDLAESAVPIFGPHPAHGLSVHDPAAYRPIIAAQLQRDLAALVGATGERQPERQPEIINRWKLLAGRLMTAVALTRGGHSLKKADVHRTFSVHAPHFTGKDFAASLWAEYLYGSVFQDRQDWVRRCRRFCENGLDVL